MILCGLPLSYRDPAGPWCHEKLILKISVFLVVSGWQVGPRPMQSLSPFVIIRLNSIVSRKRNSVLVNFNLSQEAPLFTVRPKYNIKTTSSDTYQSHAVAKMQLDY